jgi:hypothetical protein
LARAIPRKPVVINDKIDGTYTDMEVHSTHHWNEIRIYIPTAGAVRLSLTRLAREFPWTLRQALWFHESDDFPYGDEKRCAARYIDAACQKKDGHAGDHLHLYPAPGSKVVAELRWPGYLPERDATDARPRPRRRQRRYF